MYMCVCVCALIMRNKRSEKSLENVKRSQPPLRPRRLGALHSQMAEHSVDLVCRAFFKMQLPLRLSK